ncbi:methyltransferase domain-containing protein [Pendulispora brunnea]|uniref:Methyltransferase domain-containing protein n=1 Tax=Pendulispora brunnea TaxID=2905690 RepID=A0ABZ2KGM2_9BACT
MDEMNQRQIDDWNGARGARWLAHHEWLDRSFTAFGEAAFSAANLRPGEVVLDVGCGPGATTREIVRRVLPGGRGVGVDVSGPLIARARELAQGTNVAFELADASRHGFAPESFDVLFSRFGVMFFDDPEGAFAHLRTALRPNGRLAFVCWRGAMENDWFRVPYRALQAVLPNMPPVDPLVPGPFAFGDQQRIERVLRQAGFTNMAIAPFDAPLYVAADADESLDQTLRVGPFASMLAEQPEDVRRRGLTSIRTALAERATDQGVSLSGAAWIVTASA